MLSFFFDIFYNNEVISYDAFNMWYSTLSEKMKTGMFENFNLSNEIININLFLDKCLQSTTGFFQRIEAEAEGRTVKE